MLNKIVKFKNFVGSETWYYLIISIIVGFAWFLVESSFVFVMQGFLFSIGLISKSQTFLPSWYPIKLSFSLFILILFGFARASVYMFKTFYASKTQGAFVCEQRKGLLKYGLKNAKITSSKRIITAFTEVTTQAGGVVYSISTFLNAFISGALFFAMGLRLAIYEMLIGVGLLAIFMLPLKKMARKTNKYGITLIEEWEVISDYLIKGLKNYFFLSIYNQVEVELQKGEEGLNRFKENYYSYSKVVGLISSFPLLVGVVVLSAITSLSVNYLHTDAVKLVSFFYLFIRLAQAASEANATYTNIRFNLPGLKILYDWKLKLIESELEVKLPVKKINESAVRIEFRDVAFGYEKQKILFEHLDFKLTSGDVLIIKGESGTGKSTLLSLILDENKPILGDVIINGVSTKVYKLDLQDILAYVGPEPYMIAGSIKENLTYGLQNFKLSDDEIWGILKKIHIFDLIFNLEHKLDEKIYDIPQFSTGQKQRLSFARALVRNPKLLILDEATSNLDLETENIIIDNLKDALKEFTTVIVTHKDSFDKIGTKFINLKK